MKKEEIYIKLGLKTPEKFLIERTEQMYVDALKGKFDIETAGRQLGKTTNMLVEALEYVSKNPGRQVGIFAPTILVSNHIKKMFGEMIAKCDLDLNLFAYVGFHTVLDIDNNKLNGYRFHKAFIDNCCIDVGYSKSELNRKLKPNLW